MVPTFLDYDLSRDHARAEFRLEYWRDFLKLSDYDERPANGWDVRAEGYLPAYPNLGAKVSYEHYYGDDVALFGKSNLQRDPLALTAGLNYTPVPLITFSAEQRTGNSGITGLADTLTFVSDNGIGVTFTESADGVYTAAFSGTVAGSHTLTPHLSGTAVSGLSATVTLNVGEVAILSIIRSAEKAKVGETITLTITATDKGGNLVPNAKLTLNTTSITDRKITAEYCKFHFSNVSRLHDLKILYLAATSPLNTI